MLSIELDPEIFEGCAREIQREAMRGIDLTDPFRTRSKVCFYNHGVYILYNILR